MKLNKIVVLAFVASFPLLAQAGQENRGDPAPRAGDVVSCRGGEDLEIRIAKTSEGGLIASVTTQSTGDSYPTSNYRVKEVRPPAHNMGGSLRFTGRNFDLEVGIDTFPTPDGVRSFVTVDDLGISDRQVDCVLED